MKAIVIFLFSLGIIATRATEGSGTLANNALAWHWRVVDNTLKPERLDDKLNGGALPLTGDCFQLVFRDGQTMKASDFELVEQPESEPLRLDPSSPVRARHSPGRQLVAKFAAPSRHLAATFRVILRDDATYLRQELNIRAESGDTAVKEIVLFEQTVPDAQTVGTVDGSPVVAGNFFLGYEHPMSRNTVDAGQSVRCSFVRNAVLKQGETLTQSLVIGVAPQSQMRRGFLAYIARERARPYLPFLHYNSWYDIAWSDRKFTESEALNAIEQFGSELIRKRGVVMQSFLLDDGWDDSHTMWQFHNGFPNGFTAVEKATAKLNCSIGVWLSPFGGYGEARTQRLEHGSQSGFETNSSGFSLAGPKYYQAFHDICLDMVQKYKVNMFKFDGLAAGGRAAAKGLTRDGDAMLRLIADLRAAKPDIYINQTTGTWPSPFWLLYVDSTWRGGSDHDFAGKGSSRQQWITYRDAQTYNNVVQRGPLYPLNSLMLHGIIFATNAANLQKTDDQDFADEVHACFGGGTQLQELYITPALLNQTNWNDLAEAAKWARANADVLVDSHWVGGAPGKGEVYGWASWTPRKAILVLRNPDEKAATFSVDPQIVFELASQGPKTYQAVPLWNKAGGARLQLRAGKPSILELQPFEVLGLEVTPNTSVEN
jgi:hypothetical protein